VSNYPSERWTKWESKISQASPRGWTTDVYLSLCRSRIGAISFAKQADPDSEKPLVGIKAMRANAGGYLTRKKPALVRCLP